MLRYTNYDHLDMNEELNKIENSKKAVLALEPRNKKCLFILGMLFVQGVPIKLLNEQDLNFEGAKSFPKMAHVWSTIEDYKEDGFTLEKIENHPINKKIFLICPVRNATEEQRKWIEDFVEEKQENGYIVHAPHLHTNQNDPIGGGYSICKQNAKAVASSEEIDVYYDQTSTGSVFDLGVAYALHKPLRILNPEEILFEEEDQIDQIVQNWPYNEIAKQKIKQEQPKD
ncbi:MAG: hypothetical protein J6X28_01745 [Bacilli bacterium]|nr:hypothetical protein [Bacilli bacterium]